MNDALTNWLQKPGNTATALASAVGCSQSQITLIAQGKRRCTAEMAKKIHDATEIPLHELRPDLWKPEGAA